MEAQIRKVDFGIDMELRKLLRQTLSIVVSMIAIAVGAFVAGHFFAPTQQTITVKIEGQTPGR